MATLVPDTTSFSLQDVIAVTGGTSLQDAFDNSVDGLFDSNYIGTKTNLLNFRNYGIDQYSMYIINFKTRPWYRGGTIPSEKYNIYEIIYMTGTSYAIGGSYNPAIENHTRRVKYQSDDSIFIDFGASNCNIYRTPIPKVLVVTDEHQETLLPINSLYFWFSINSNSIKSLNTNVIFERVSPYGIRMNFELVEKTTSIPSLSVSVSELHFDAHGIPYIVDYFDIVASGDWYIIVEDEFVLSLDYYYGTGNQRIVVEPEYDGTHIIEIHSMSNDTPKYIDIIMDTL
jgi:sucrose-6-phosphate hydrolase SacC (GH32 family)